MASWSVSRLFRKVSAQDFGDAVTGLRESLERRGVPVFTEIGFYRRRKPGLSSGGIDRDGGGMVTRLNPVQEFKFVSDPRDITPAIWNQADYVEAVLQPIDGTNVTARIEAKGLRPRQMTFSVGPDHPGEEVRADSLGHYGRWRKGDGVDSNSLTYGLV